MAKFKKKANVKQDIPTSSMPDVVFILLFFFMVTTELREQTIEVQQRAVPRTAIDLLFAGERDWLHTEEI